MRDLKAQPLQFNFNCVNELYHGSKVIVKNPVIVNSYLTKDFGPGFYCIRIQTQAEKWARRRAKNGVGFVSVFTFDERYLRNYRVKLFKGYSKEWLDFVANCRAGLPHDYDVVDGPVADDEVYDYVSDYLQGKIHPAYFMEMCKFKRPTNQVCFCSQQLLDCAVEFSRAYEVRCYVR